ncbi:MAG: hypothetical protein QM680_13730 [Luteolibacter sp.]
MIIPSDEAWKFFDALMVEIPWKQDETAMFGKPIVTSRKIAWFGDSEFEYTYSGITKRALAWCETLKTLRGCLENLSNHG